MYRTPEAVILVVQLLRLVWRVIWFALTHPLLDAVAALVVVAWLGPGLARCRGPGGGRRDRPGRAAGDAAGVVRPVRGGAGAGPVAVVVLPAPLEGRDDAGRARPGLPGPADAAGARPGAPRRVRGPGAGRPGDRAGARRLRRQDREPGARLRRPAVPGPRRRAGHRDAGAGPRGHPRRADPRPADRWRGRPGQAAGGPVRGRVAMAAAAGLHARADRGCYRVREGLGDLVDDPRAAARDHGGWVQVWALDPKRMELSFGRALFHRYACHATAMVELLEAAVAEMHDRAGQFGGRTRTFPLSAEFPFVVVLVDELAFLTAYQPDRDLRKRAEAAIATLTSQGRSVGVCVVGALQDPRKDVISLRNLFSTRIALRLDESDQVDMVLGDGARDRGALADQISPLPDVGAGVGYVRLEASPDPVRVRAAYVTDEDIRAMAAAVGCLPGGGL